MFRGLHQTATTADTEGEEQDKTLQVNAETTKEETFMKDNFIMYLTYYDAVMILTDEQAGQLLKGIFDFAKTGKKKSFQDRTVMFAYNVLTSNIEQSNKQYEEKCKRNRENIMKRWNAKEKVVNEGNNSNTTEYDGIRPNTTEYQQNSCIPMICNDIDNDIDLKRQEDEEEEPSLFEGKPSNSSTKFTSNCYDAVMDYWNNRVQAHGSAMKQIKAMTERRKSAIRARMREHGNDLTVIYDMIVNAVTSDFLNGKNSRNKIFTFDALFAPDMFQKTLEGNFNDRKPTTAAGQQQSGISQLMEQQSQEQHKDRQQEQRNRFNEMIETVKKNPNHRCRAILESAARNGTLKALGISWEPSTNENKKTIKDN